MTELFGFTLQHSQLIPELQCTAHIYQHEKSAARLLSVVSEDENKVFGVNFRTPPKNSTGLAHVLEHSVLCGSEKYPVKEPFVELIKGSLQTFLNAMTYPDKTCYPVASANLQDFYNLVDVYLDAVFHPLLTPQVLMQEGWHYELDDDNKLSVKGVVYNEMKGAYSSPDSLLHQRSQQSLFPNTTYGLDSGGDPKHIPDLSWEDFSGFHRRHYHPSNSYIFFYGDDPEEDRLRRLDAVLSDFSAQQVDSAIALQPAFNQPVQQEHAYVAEAQQGDAGRSMFTLNLALGEIFDPEENLAWHILEQLLIGLPSSPLRKALMDSGLGEDLAGVGLEDELRQQYFSVGLKGMQRADVDKAEKVIWDCLGELAENGIHKDEIAAAMNTVEFALREQNTGSYPRGLLLMFEALSTWIYDADPLALLPFEDRLEKIKVRLQTGEDYFEQMIRERLLNNPHRSRVLLYPDSELDAQNKEAESKAFAKILQNLDTAQQEEIREQAKMLQAKQEKADSPEDLAKIPRLRVADMPKENAQVATETSTSNDVVRLFHPLATRGIVYLDLAFDLRVLPADLLPYAGLFARVLVEMGTEKQDFVDLSRRIARRTGGIDPGLFISAKEGSAEDYVARLIVRAKSTPDQADEMLDILRDLLLQGRVDDLDRLAQIIMESKARHEQHVIPSGHSLVSSRLRAHSGAAGRAAEQIHGIDQLNFLRLLVQRLEREPQAIVADLQRLRDLVLNASALVVNLTCDAHSKQALEPHLDALIAALPNQAQVLQKPAPLSLPKAEGLSIPAQIKFTGLGARVSDGGYAYSGADMVVSRYLGTTYLWDKVRVQGGAYGAFCSMERHSGYLGLVSYRDPGLDTTLEAYRGLIDFLRQHQPQPEELEKSIVGAIGEIDRYRLPDAKAYISLLRYLIGDDEKRRAQLRSEVLAAESHDFKRFAEAVDWAVQNGQICVMGDEDSLAASVAGLSVTKVFA